MPSPARAERALCVLSIGFLALLGATFGLIVLGALVRAHGAGLACPDWPLCFGRWIPAFDLRVGFEWTHRLVAGGVALAFAGLALAAWRHPEARRCCGGWLAVAAALLVTQIALGALTVSQLLASWTVTSHLLAGNAFAACLLLIALRLRRAGATTAPRGPVPAASRAWLALASAALALQLVLGGLVSSRYAGLACPEWPACNGGVWFPSFGGAVGLHLLHRWNGHLLGLLLIGAALATRASGRVGRALALAAGLGALQVVVGVLNVRLGLPVEVTGLHSALAAALVLSLAAAGAEAFATASGARSGRQARGVTSPGGSR
jgi:cytochrome c oxidase assembly protein subunit 15